MQIPKVESLTESIAVNLVYEGKNEHVTISLICSMMIHDSLKHLGRKDLCFFQASMTLCTSPCLLAAASSDSKMIPGDLAKFILPSMLHCFILFLISWGDLDEFVA